MKLRLKGNSLRLRLTQSEVARLGDGGDIVEIVRFGEDENQILVYELVVESESETLTASFQNNRITIKLPHDLARELAHTARAGVRGEQVLGNETDALLLLIEKDFACIDGDSGEDQSDAFPNPNSQC